MDRDIQSKTQLNVSNRWYVLDSNTYHLLDKFSCVIDCISLPISLIYTTGMTPLKVKTVEVE